MKKIFTINLVVILLLSLTACDSGTETSTDAQKSAPASSDIREAPVAEQLVEQPPIIERSVLFGNPLRFQGRLSPDGTKMSFRAPLDGVMNLWVGDRGDFSSVKAITSDTGRGIPTHFWALDSQHVLYTQDQGGDENWHLFSVDLASGGTIDLSPYEGVQAQMLAQSETVPGVVIVGMNDRDPKWHDVYSVDLSTGERTLLSENNGFASILVDNDFNVRLATQPTPSGGLQVLSKSDEEWEPLFEIPFEDVQTTNILGFDGDNQGIYLLDSRNRNTAALVHITLADLALTTIAESDRTDISSVLIDPRTHKPFAYALNLIKPEYHAINLEYKDVIASFNSQLSGGSQVLAQSLSNQFWTVYTDESDSSPIYKVFDASNGEFSDLFVTNPALNEQSLAKMHGVVIPSRDGMELVSYLTLPLESDADQDGVPGSPVPMVMLVHGGPWGRDVFGYSPVVQWLANRGYAVLQVNFRSSTGFGKDFLNAGNKQWSGAMHNDLLDAKKWAVEQGITSADKVAIMGGSYGGYATLVGLTITPDEFSCGVDIVGPSNLVTLLGSIPPYWEAFRTLFEQAIGDPETEEGLSLLKATSPLTHADKITKPLLIAQGANDPRVKQAESDQIVAAMSEKGIPVTYVLYPDEGHGFQKPENNLSFYAVAEAFLAECQGGRYQELGNDFENSSIQIPHGAEFIPGIDGKL
ncbi:MAG: S9 family peptidase [Xanthomonadales bacterium]|nr:S9 family peptidase [Xanthomonadales bacterium]